MFALLIILIFIVYLFTYKSNIYANAIKINVCKLVSIEINNKVKCPGQTGNPPEHSDE